MTQTIEQTFKHVSRHAKGIQNPVHTLECGSGSCRDLAGIAARFVSGYLRLTDDADDQDLTGGNTHAWVQIYVLKPWRNAVARGARPSADPALTNATTGMQAAERG
jgi:Transglutaminase-like superfamily